MSLIICGLTSWPASPFYSIRVLSKTPTHILYHFVPTASSCFQTTSKFQVKSTNIGSTLFRRLDVNVEPTFDINKRRQNNVDVLSTLSTYFQPNFDVVTASYARWELISSRLNCHYDSIYNFCYPSRDIFSIKIDACSSR